MKLWRTWLAILTAVSFTSPALALDWVSSETGSTVVGFLGEAGNTAYVVFTATGTTAALVVHPGAPGGVFCVNADQDSTGGNSLVLTLDELVGETQDANHWQAWQMVGNCQYELGDKAGALVSYQRSLDINPDNPTLKQWADQLAAQ